MMNRHATVAADQIARDIFANCERFHAQQIDKATWDAEQIRLWDIAAKACLARDVMKIVAPSLGHK